MNMRKFTKQLCLLLACALCLCVSLIGCGEQEITDAVYVSIAVKGEMVLTYQAVALEDKDGDGATTINDALQAAHDAHFDGTDGFASAQSEYGLSLNKLWGDTSGAYGYMLNNASVATSLSEPVKVGDHVYAYVYADQTTWSDTYCYFDKAEMTVAAGESFTLTLMSAGFDENWAPVSKPVAGATITINGESIDTKTNDAGQITISMGEKSKKDAFVVSATSDAIVMVPPVCLVTVE
jgi:hypothetical protein